MVNLLLYFKKAKALPTTEDTGIGDKATWEAKKCVAEVIERQQAARFNRKIRIIKIWSHYYSLESFSTKSA